MINQKETSKKFCHIKAFNKFLYSNVVAGSEREREGGSRAESWAGDDPGRDEEDAGDWGWEGEDGSEEEEHAAEKVWTVNYNIFFSYLVFVHLFKFSCV